MMWTIIQTPKPWSNLKTKPTNNHATSIPQQATHLPLLRSASCETHHARFRNLRTSRPATATVTFSTASTRVPSHLSKLNALCLPNPAHFQIPLSIASPHPSPSFPATTRFQPVRSTAPLRHAPSSVLLAWLPSLQAQLCVAHPSSHHLPCDRRSHFASLLQFPSTPMTHFNIPQHSPKPHLFIPPYFSPPPRRPHPTSPPNSSTTPPPTSRTPPHSTGSPSQ